MQYISHRNVITIENETWWVNANVSGLFTKMLKKLIGQINAMLSHHNKIHIVVFDLHVDTYTPDNKCVTDFNRRLFGMIESRYSTTRIGYAWAREQETSSRQHYHYALILDGNKIQHPRHILKMTGDIWEHMGGHRWIPENYYYNISRYDRDELQKAIWRISYLAKGRGKEKNPSQAKDYSTSRIVAKLTV